MADKLWSCLAILLIYLCGVCCADLCNVDPQTGLGFECSNQCCGDHPMGYCCDKTEVVVQSAVFGSFGCLFIILFVVCCIRTKLKSKKDVNPDLKKKKPIQAAVSGSNVGPKDTNPSPTTTTTAAAANTHADTDANETKVQPPPGVICVTPIADPGTQQPQLPSEPMYEEDTYPTAATPVPPASR